MATVAAPRARTMTAEQRIARSLELADRDHLTYRSRYHQINEHGEAVFSVPSRTQPHRFHIVRLLSSGEWSCTCAAGEHGLPCGHLGSAAHHWRQIAEAMSAAAADATRRYQAFGVWLETRGW